MKLVLALFFTCLHGTSALLFPAARRLHRNVRASSAKAEHPAVAPSLVVKHPDKLPAVALVSGMSCQNTNIQLPVLPPI
jgi:hypothetical protein